MCLPERAMNEAVQRWPIKRSSSRREKDGQVLSAQEDETGKGRHAWHDIMKHFKEENDPDGSLLLHREEVAVPDAVYESEYRTAVRLPSIPHV